MLTLLQFTAGSDGERLLKTIQHLTKVMARRLVAPFLTQGWLLTRFLYAALSWYLQFII